jgi:trehalose/maltose hydrolase-like predicted phosphorylase
MWVVPGATLLDRTVGEGALAYREARLAGAAAKAQSYGDGWRGAMFPWECESRAAPASL